MGNIFNFIRSFIVIYICLYIGIFISAHLPIAIPGSIIGLIILFILLSFQIVKPEWVNPGCSLLIRYMALLFVPIGVGVMQYAQLLRMQFGPVVLSCVVSTALVLIVVSWCSHVVHGKNNSGRKS
ncbi:TPA: CidA/LrgA family protein [Salmonella enterica subsp. enterica serovar Newport]